MKKMVFVGNDPEFFRHVGLVLYPRTRFISPQFHVCYDNWFTTAYSDESTSLPNWQDLLTYSTQRVCDDDGRAPFLINCWLFKKERADKRIKQAKKWAIWDAWRKKL